VATTALLVATLMHLVCAAPTGTTAVAACGSDARHPTAAGALRVAVRGRRKQRRKQRRLRREAAKLTPTPAPDDVSTAPRLPSETFRRQGPPLAT